MTDGWGISCKIVLRWMPQDLTDDKSTLVQVMAWYHQATSHCLSQCWHRFMSQYGVTRPQWVNAQTHHCYSLCCIKYISKHRKLKLQTDNRTCWHLKEEKASDILFLRKPDRLNTLWLNDAIWRHRSESTLAHVMACCLVAPSHYLNQCGLITGEVLWHFVEGNCIRNI